MPCKISWISLIWCNYQFKVEERGTQINIFTDPLSRILVYNLTQLWNHKYFSKISPLIIKVLHYLIKVLNWILKIRTQVEVDNQWITSIIKILPLMPTLTIHHKKRWTVTLFKTFMKCPSKPITTSFKCRKTEVAIWTLYKTIYRMECLRNQGNKVLNLH